MDDPFCFLWFYVYRPRFLSRSRTLLHGVAFFYAFTLSSTLVIFSSNLFQYSCSILVFLCLSRAYILLCISFFPLFYLILFFIPSVLVLLIILKSSNNYFFDGNAQSISFVASPYRLPHVIFSKFLLTAFVFLFFSIILVLYFS